MTTILVGCSTTIDPNKLVGPVTQQWQFNGKFAVRSVKETKSAKINWQQLNDQFDINLYTTFGITVMKINGGRNHVQIDDGSDTYKGTSAGHLIWQLTGWHVPIDQMQQWVQGDVKQAINVKLDQYGRFKSGDIIGENGQVWHLKLSKYKNVDGYIRPHSLLLSQQKLFFKLAISKWQIQK
ncbi:MAG: outer membrane lipoprotein LolB [Psychrobium sp.]|nr:outer membrane lipoprotein LolB [Psychrobium sp.]